MHICHLINKLKWFIFVFWILVAVLVSTLCPSLSSVTNVDSQSYFPNNADTVQFSKMEKQYFNNNSGTSIFLVLQNKHKINSADEEYAKQLEVALLSRKSSYKITSIQSPFTEQSLVATMKSTDGKVALIYVKLDLPSSSTRTNSIIRTIRNDIKSKNTAFSKVPVDLQVNVTGEAAFSEESAHDISQSLQLTMIVTLILVVFISVLIYRSIVAPCITLATIILSLIISRGTIASLTYLGIRTSSYTEQFLVAVLFGAGTDYCLLLISRYKEQLEKLHSPEEALATIFKPTVLTIISSGGTVIIGFLCMVFTKFGLFSSTGPNISIGIAIMLLITLTFAPSLILIFGKFVFWPNLLYKKHAVNKSRGGWDKISYKVTTSPLLFILVCFFVLLPFMINTVRIKTSYDSLASLPASSDAMKGFNIIKSRFNEGEVMPVSIVVHTNANLMAESNLNTIDSIAASIAKVDGVKKVYTATRPTGTLLSEATLPTEISNLSSGLGKINTGLSSLNDGLTSANSSFLVFSDQLSKGAQELQTLGSETSAIDSEGITPLLSGIQSSQQELTQLNSGLTSGSSALSALSNTTTAFSKELGDVKLSLGGGNNVSQGNVSALENTISKFANSIQNSQNDLKTMQVQISNAYTDLGNVLSSNPELAKNNDFVNACAILENISEHDLADSDGEFVSNLSSLNGDITQLQQELSQVSNDQKMIGQQLSNMGQKTGEFNTSVGSMQSSLSQIHLYLNELATAQEQLGSRMSEANSSISTLSQKLKDGSSSVSQIESGVDVMQKVTASYSNMDSIFYLPDGALTEYPQLKDAVKSYLSTNSQNLQFNVILSYSPFSDSALASISKIKGAIQFALKGTPLKTAQFYIGGQTAVSETTKELTTADFISIIIFVLLGIFVVLVLLLKSLVSPVYMILTILMSYCSTMGVSCLVFQDFLKLGSLNWAVPIFSFCFLVAMGVDYNIFLMMRIKEEYHPQKMKSGTATALANTGRIITSCGVIMAGTFLSFLFSPISMISQIGFTVVFGLLLDTFFIRILFVPAIAVKLGDLNWWPGKKLKIVTIKNDLN